MIYLIGEGIYSQLCQVPGFIEEYGNTYRDYVRYTIRMSSDVTEDIKEVIQDLKESETIFKTLEEFKIPYEVSN
jgi:hypothetical protein